MSAVIVIPARYDSTRFPGKPLVTLKGKPVIQHVYDNAKGAASADDVIVATDSETIFETVLAFGGKAAMTSEKHVSGTDRVAEVAGLLSCDIIVNVQGDEPLIRPEMIDDAIRLLSDEGTDIGTLAKKIERAEEILDTSVVKVVRDIDGYALYFSRAPIPYHRDEWKDLSRIADHESHFTAFKHVGIYSYRREALLRLTGMRPSALEKVERLEQLRALENGFRIKVGETLLETVGIDTPEDLERVEEWLSISS
jgi:3-deoxy-manno-octulosonate cytidylyltransferase (CMP-KDO synthetase)